MVKIVKSLKTNCRFIIAAILTSFNIALAVNLAHNDIYASKYNHDVRHGMPQTKIFQDSQVDEARWADAVTIRIRTAVAN